MSEWYIKRSSLRCHVKNAGKSKELKAHKIVYTILNMPHSIHRRSPHGCIMYMRATCLVNKYEYIQIYMINNTVCWSIRGEFYIRHAASPHIHDAFACVYCCSNPIRMPFTINRQMARFFCPSLNVNNRIQTIVHSFKSQNTTEPVTFKSCV